MEGVHTDPEDASAEAAAVEQESTPRRPPQEEVDRHMLTHLPYRSWCPHCVRGKSRGKHHSGSTGSKQIPTIAVDYMYMHESQDANEEKGMPILVARDLNLGGVGTGMVFARVVPSKGVQAYAVKSLAADVTSLGYNEFVFKTIMTPRFWH